MVIYFLFRRRVWRAGVDTLEEGETLDYDPSAYVTYHSLKTEWPCLSFDILRDNLGEGRIRVGPISLFPQVNAHISLVSLVNDVGGWITSRSCREK